MLFIFFIIIIILYFIFFTQGEHFTQQVATERDIKLAQKNVLQKICIDKGYNWKEGGDEFSYDCLHTKQTCLRDSIYPTYADKAPTYYEWRSEPNNDRCIIGNEAFREFCEKEGLTYSPDSGKCKTNKKYCSSKGLPYCNGDCYIPPLQWVSEQVFGTTLGRTIAQASPERWIVEGACKLEEE